MDEVQGKIIGGKGTRIKRIQVPGVIRSCGQCCRADAFKHPEPPNLCSQSPGSQEGAVLQPPTEHEVDDAPLEYATSHKSHCKVARVQWDIQNTKYKIQNVGELHHWPCYFTLQKET